VSTQAVFVENAQLEKSQVISASSEYGLYLKTPEPFADNEGLLILDAKGQPRTASDLQISLASGGNIGSAEWAWREYKGAGNAWRGKNRDALFDLFQLIYNSTGIGGFSPSGLRTSTGRVLLFYSRGTGGRDLRCVYHDPDDSHGIWSSAIQIVTGLGINQAFPVAIEDTARERILLFYRDLEDATYKIKIYISTDDGASWSLFRTMYASSNSIEYLQVAYNDGIIRIAWLEGGTTIKTRVSLDGGFTFSSLSDLTNVDNASFGLARTENSQEFILVYQYTPATTPTVYYVTSARTEDWSSETTIQSDAESPRIIQADDYLYLLLFEPTENVYHLFRSIDNGSTWTDRGQPFRFSDQTLIVASDANLLMYQEAVAVVAQMDRTGVLPYNNNIALLSGQRFSTVTIDDTYDFSYYGGLGLPGLNGWTQSGTGGTVTQVEGEEIEIDTSAASCTFYRDFTANLGGSTGMGALAHFAIKVVSGGSTIRPDIAAALVISDGTNRWGVHLWFSASRILLRDAVAGTTIAVANKDMTAGFVELLCAIQGTNCYAWYRNIGNSRWTRIGSSTSLSSTTGTDNQFTWGHADPNSTATSRWLFVNYIENHNNLADGFSNPSDLNNIITKRLWQYTANGQFIKWNGSGGVFGDGWRLRTGYRFAKENILETSPSIFFRSADDNSDVNIVLDRDPDHGVKKYHIDYLGLIKTNFKTCSVEWNDTDDWTSPAKTESLDCELTTGTVRVVTASSVRVDGIPWIPGRYDGKYVRMTSGSASGKTYRILRNKANELFLDVTSSIIVDGVAGGDTFAIFSDQFIKEVTGTPNIAIYRYMRIVIPAQETAEGYFKIGAFLAGKKFKPSPSFDWGFSFSTTPNVTIYQSRTGLRFAREEGAPRRSYSVRFSGTKQDCHLELEKLLRFLGYSVKPALFIHVESGNLHEIGLYGRFTGDLSQTVRAYYKENDTWIPANDIGEIRFEEEL